jgi:PhzF family phenazine biosynthesis protein
MKQFFSRPTSGSGMGLSRRAFLRLSAWASTGVMSTAIVKIRRIQEKRSDQTEVVHTRVFAAGRNGGNPCPVVLFADRLTDSEMQGLARRFGLDTVFILKPHSDATDIRLRYFVPDHEMGISGHATIAAVTVALVRKIVRSDHLKIETVSGLFEVAWLRTKDRYLVSLEQNPPVFGAKASPDQVAPALNIAVNDIAVDESPVQAVSVSRAKLVVPLKDWHTLDRLAPDFDTLWRLCDDLQVSGLYPFTRHTNKESADVEARQFPLRAGFLEDAATGVAAAALGAYLAKYDLKCQRGRHEFQIAQGYAMGAPSLITAIAECADDAVTRTAIRGVAHVVQSERITVQKAQDISCLRGKEDNLWMK